MGDSYWAVYSYASRVCIHVDSPPMDEFSLPGQAGDDRTPLLPSPECLSAWAVLGLRTGVWGVLPSSLGHPLALVCSPLPITSPSSHPFHFSHPLCLDTSHSGAQGHQVGRMLVLQVLNIPTPLWSPGPVCIDIWFFLCHCLPLNG